MNLVYDIARSVEELDQEAWDALGGDQCFFLSHRFIRALERTDCVGPEVGWAMHFVTARDTAGRLVGASPTWAKAHSMGEFVYDWAWADFSHKNGIPYYPKLVASVPFTPATGRRLLVCSSLSEDARVEVRAGLVSELARLCDETNLAGAHILFCQQEELGALEAAGFFRRTQHQYHWKNHGYDDFEEFLGCFRSKRRREVRRQRRRLSEVGYRVRCLDAEELGSYVDFAYTCYVRTIEKFSWGKKYLTRAFFEEVFVTCPTDIRLFVAFDAEDEPIACALCFADEDTLYGRYWGALRDDVPFLHFETCLYAPIDYCIQQGLSTLEPGQGGEHKLTRGYEATVTYSAHRMSDPRLHAALADYCAREEEAVVTEVEALNARFAPRHEDR